MESSIDILNELKALSPVLAGIDKVNVFTVPQGYFETLGATVLMSVKEETGDLLGAIGNQSSMQVPQGYFESLAGNILDKIKAQDNEAIVLNELSPALLAVQKENVFTVPQGYFESLANNILDKIKTADNSVAAELKELSPLLHGISNKNVFTVPQGYFEDLPATIAANVKPQQAKVVSMGKRTTSILKYAIAAVFTGVIALGVYKFTGTGSKTVVLPGYVAEGQKITNVDEELAKVSDEELIKYLQANGTGVDAAVVATTMDENELPTQEDYLTDEKALDKYFDNVDLNELKN